MIWIVTINSDNEYEVEAETAGDAATAAGDLYRGDTDHPEDSVHTIWIRRPEMTA